MKLTLEQVALCLDLPAHTVARWIRQGRIPIYRDGDFCSFRQATLNRWATAHNLTFTPPGAVTPKASEKMDEALTPVLRRSGVCYGLKGDDPETVLRAAADQVYGLSAAGREELVEGLIEREKLASTGIGKGIAIPHPRTPLSDLVKRPRITTCFLERPLDFNALDARPVFVLFLLLSPSIRSHLHLLSRLSFCVRNEAFVDFLKSIPQPEAIFEKIFQFEALIEKSGPAGSSA